MPVYSRSVLPYTSGVALGAIIKRVETANDGTVSISQYWDRARGGWDNELDVAKHVQPLERLTTNPAHCDWKFQVWAVPIRPLGDPACIAAVYTLSAEGEPKDLYQTLGQTELTILANQSN